MKPFHTWHVLKSVVLGSDAVAVIALHKLGAHISGDESRSDDDDALDQSAIKIWQEFFAVVEDTCVELELICSLDSVRRIKQIVAGVGPTFTALHPLHLELRDRLIVELAGKKFWSMTVSEAEQYEPSKPIFGAEVSSKFPSASYEIDEAAKCLALSRCTAGAFHSIRCLEAAVRAVSRCLSIPDPTKGTDRSWGKMLGSVRSEIDRRWPPNTGRLTGDARTFDELYASLAAIQNPWRNATMHLDQKYTDEEARHIFDVVGGLMRRVALRCDEDGEPRA